jgi:hypothetical protein
MLVKAALHTTMAKESGDGTNKNTLLEPRVIPALMER